MLKRRTRPRPYNPRRRARLKAQQFGTDGYVDWIKWLPCDNCGDPPPNDPSHIRTRGAGHGPGQMVPHCRWCHTELNEGIDTVSAKWEYDLRSRPAVYLAHWQAINQADTNGVPVRELLRRRGDGLSHRAALVIDEHFELVTDLYRVITDPTDIDAFSLKQTIDRAASLLERGGLDLRTGESVR